MTSYSFEGVHLLPNYQYPYIQRTYCSEGVEIADYIVYACDLCGKRLGDISDYFSVVDTFSDPDTGLPQLDWQILDCENDFGFRLIYLEIIAGDVNYYSSPFMLTTKRGDYVSNWFYRNDADGQMLSVGLVSYFRQKKSQQEIANYTAVSNGFTYTATSRLTKFEKWNIGLCDINIIETFKDLFTLRYVYSQPANFGGQLPVKTGLFEAFETPDLSADENFAEQEINLLRNYGQSYDPLYVPVVPDPPVNPPTITLNSVVSLDPNTVQFDFSYANFSPSYLTLQFASSPTGPWLNTNSNTGSVVSPRTMVVPNNLTAGYYYRVYYIDLDLPSNVLQLPNPAIVITNVVSTDGGFSPSGNKYNIFYTLTSISSQPATYAEVSVDGVNWVTAYFQAVPNTNPRFISTPPSALEFKYFRLRYLVLPYVSNIYFFEF